MVTRVADGESALCIWCNKQIEPGQMVEVIHVTEPNALGISRNNCFEQLKTHLHAGENENVNQNEGAEQPVPEGYEAAEDYYVPQYFHGLNSDQQQGPEY